MSQTVKRILDQAAYIAERFSPCPVTSLYFGGGTPSILPYCEWEKIFTSLDRMLVFSDDCEITLEVHPESVNHSFWNWIHSSPINRLSLGIQSFDEEVLRLLGRNSNRSAAIRAAEQTACYGPGNWSLDLIGEIPGVPGSVLTEDFRQAVFWRPPHLSAYALSFSGNSLLGKRLKDKEVESFVDEAFDFASGFGYHRYEISSCSKSGNESRHNLSYWRMDPFWGFGPSGSGTFRNEQGKAVRWEGISPLKVFLDPLKKTADTWKKEMLTDRQFAFECVMMGCRLAAGINLEEFYHKTGYDLTKMAPQTIKKAVNERLFGIENNCFFPYSSGFRFLNRFLVDFLFEFDKNPNIE